MDAVRSTEYAHLANAVPHYQDPSVMRPAIFNYLCRQGKNETTKKFLNALLINVMLKMKHPNDRPYQPSTIATNFRSLFSSFEKQNIPYKLSDFKNWPGALIDVMNQTWQRHQEQDCSFGVTKKEEFTEQDYEAIVKFISGLSANGRRKLRREIVNFSLGVHFGLRGRQEHRDLKLSEISFGRYSSTALAGLAGLPYVQIGGKGPMLSKSNRLTFGELLGPF